MRRTPMQKVARDEMADVELKVGLSVSSQNSFARQWQAGDVEATPGWLRRATSAGARNGGCATGWLVTPMSTLPISAKPPAANGGKLSQSHDEREWFRREIGGNSQVASPQRKSSLPESASPDCRSHKSYCRAQILRKTRKISRARRPQQSVGCSNQLKPMLHAMRAMRQPLNVAPRHRRDRPVEPGFKKPRRPAAGSSE